MIEKTVYVAADGKEFESKTECLKYETASMLKGLHFYDDYKKPMFISSDNFSQFFSSVYYVQAESIEALDKLNELCDISGYATIPYKDLNTNCDDLFYYFDDDESWHSLKNDLKELKELADHFQIFYEYEY